MAQSWGVSDPEMAYDLSKIHRIKFDDIYQRLNGFHQAHSSPQRSPDLCQAGASKSGIVFAGKARLRTVRAAARENGRDPSTIKVFAAIVPILGRTVEEAQANIGVEAGLAKFSSYIGIDLAQHPMSEPLIFEAKTG
ncbi:hypothetical protein BP5796_01042 [Coleophoma crateriformis]|uniref:Uncharacterized protein n=1 Tax=Coleophoma crateriformis TaxID=565419 RepID=A0A3D8T9M4_9HELO|nr:hypothetical protein BP5796_01042 [Coleophoma crateriformis]